MALLETEPPEVTLISGKLSSETTPNVPRNIVPDTPPHSPGTEIASLGLNQIGTVKELAAEDKTARNPLDPIVAAGKTSDGGYYRISPAEAVAALDFHYSSALPEIEEVFPWMHGCNENNVSQRAFLDPMKRFRDLNNQPVDLNRALEIMMPDNPVFSPPSNARGLVVIKVGDASDSHGSLVGSITPEEVLADQHGRTATIDHFSQNAYHKLTGNFLNLDPDEGISLRNFHIQVAKWATISDILVYCCSEQDTCDAIFIAKLLVEAQKKLRCSVPSTQRKPGVMYNTFYLPFDAQNPPVDAVFNLAAHCVSMPSLDYFERNAHRNSRLGLIDEWKLKNWGKDFLFHERVEMSMMSTATRLEDNVWLGNAVDFENCMDSIYALTNFDLKQYSIEHAGDEAEVVAAALNARLKVKDISGKDENTVKYLTDRNWATMINCYEGGTTPSVETLQEHIRDTEEKINNGEEHLDGALLLSIPYGFSDKDQEVILLLCKLLHLRSKLKFGDHPAGALIFCSDGYTESSVPALAYLMYSQGYNAADAWMQLHLKYKRCFFCFQQDVFFLKQLELLLWATAGKTELKNLPVPSSRIGWFNRMDGSLPSQILPHVYLGSLVHADNPEMLNRMGINRVLSVGERPYWPSTASFKGKALYVDNVQDDGVDSLRDQLTLCLNFLDEGFKAGEPTLVHCRVGVSRSATVCIAEVMRRLGVGLPRAYLFVRVRRLNVIIQPNLRFMYELLKWEEYYRNASEGWLREVDWHIFCREISMLNRFYIN